MYTLGFIVEKCEGKIKVENLRKQELIKLLTDRGFQSDPIKRWKEKVTRERGYLHDSVGGEANRNTVEETDEIENKNTDYNYLLSMPLWNLTLEKKEEILKQQKAKGAELKALQVKTSAQLWLDDLAEFKSELEKFEQKEREEIEISIKKNLSKTAKLGSSSSLFNNSSNKPIKYEYLPTPDGERVEPKMDAPLLQKAEQARLAQKVKKEENTMNIVDMISTDLSQFSDEKHRQLREIAFALANPGKAKPVTSGTPKKKETVNKETNGHSEANGERNTPVKKETNGHGEENGEKKTPVKKEEAKKRAVANGNESGKKRVKKEKLTVDSESEASFDSEGEEERKAVLAAAAAVEKRELARPRKQVKYNFDEESSEDEAEFVPVDHGDEDLMGIDAENSEDESKKKSAKTEKVAKKAAAVKAKVATVKKKKTDQDEEEEEASFGAEEESDFDFSEKKAAAVKKPKINDSVVVKEKKEAAKKPAPARKKTALKDDDEDSVPSVDAEDDSDFEFGGKKKATAGKKVAAAARKTKNDDSVVKMKVEEKLEVVKKAAAKKKAVLKDAADAEDSVSSVESGDDSDFEFGGGKKKAPATAAAKKTTGKKKAESTPKPKKPVVKRKKVESDEGDDDEYAFDDDKPKKKVKPVEFKPLVKKIDVNKTNNEDEGSMDSLDKKISSFLE